MSLGRLNYEIIVYSVPKHINTARMHTISRRCIPLIHRPPGKRILSNIQPTLPFDLREIVPSSNFTCLNFVKKYIYIYQGLYFRYIVPTFSCPYFFSRHPIGKGMVFDRIDLTRFNKIAIQGTHQMAVDKEAICLSRVYSYYFMCNPP